MDYGLLTHVQISPEGLADPGGVLWGVVVPERPQPGHRDNCDGPCQQPMSPPARAQNSGQRSGTRQLLLLRSPHPLAAALTLPSWLFGHCPQMTFCAGARPFHDPGSLSPWPRHGRTSLWSRGSLSTAGGTPAWKGKGRPPGLFHENGTTAPEKGFLESQVCSSRHTGTRPCTRAGGGWAQPYPSPHTPVPTPVPHLNAGSVPPPRTHTCLLPGYSCLVGALSWASFVTL